MPRLLGSAPIIAAKDFLTREEVRDVYQKRAKVYDLVSNDIAGSVTAPDIKRWRAE